MDSPPPPQAPTPNVIDGRANEPLGSIEIVTQFLYRLTNLVIWLQVVGK